MNGITLLGLAAAAFTTGAYVPQVIKTWKTKNTKDLSLPTFAIISTGIALWIAYGLMRKDMPLIAANALTLVLTSAILCLKIKYK